MTEEEHLELCARNLLGLKFRTRSILQRIEGNAGHCKAFADIDQQMSPILLSAFSCLKAF